MKTAKFHLLRTSTTIQNWETGVVKTEEFKVDERGNPCQVSDIKRMERKLFKLIEQSDGDAFYEWANDKGIGLDSGEDYSKLLLNPVN